MLTNTITNLNNLETNESPTKTPYRDTVDITNNNFTNSGSMTASKITHVSSIIIE